MRKMVGGLLGRVRNRAFSSKCKSGVKRIRYRIEMIQRRKTAVIRYLKNDIAQLLDIGFDTNAYSRAEGLTKEMKISSCYCLLDQFCECILEQLPSMEKQRECPPESEEAVSTLIYASVRFADLPELYDLRHLFRGRFGETMESSVNKEFIEKTSWKRPSVDQKLNLLQEISEEFSVNFDLKALSEKIANSTPFEHAEPKQPESTPGMEDASPIGECEPEFSSWSATESEEETDSPIASKIQHQMPLDHDLTSATTPDTTINIPPPPYLKSRVKEHATDLVPQHTDSTTKHLLKPILVENGANEGSKSESIQEGFDQNIHDREKIETPVSDSSPYEKPKPRSVRRNLRRRFQESETSTESNLPVSPALKLDLEKTSSPGGAEPGFGWDSPSLKQNRKLGWWS